MYINAYWRLEFCTRKINETHFFFSLDCCCNLKTLIYAKGLTTFFEKQKKRNHYQTLNFDFIYLFFLSLLKGGFISHLLYYNTIFEFF